MSRSTRLTTASALALSVALLAACSSGSPDSTSGGGDGEDRGPITYAQGKDNSGTIERQLAEWNAAHPGEEVTLVELPESSDAQRQQHIQNAQTESDAFTVIALDNVWVAEFAANQWVDPLPNDMFPAEPFLPAVYATGLYRDQLYSVPRVSDGGLLYYRTDLLEAAGIAAPPTSWDEMVAQCALIQATPEGAGVGCYAGQFEKYEGLTVNFAEAVNGAGGVITDENGVPDVDTPEALAGLTQLVDGLQSGIIPAEAITYKEEEGRQAFQAGKLAFHRQWPYQYSLANATDGSSQVAGKFEVTGLPGVSSLGGWGVSISAYATHKDTALDFIQWFTSEERQRQNLVEASNAPVYASLYDEPDLVAEFAYLPALKASILSAQARPRVVNYGDVTAAIQDSAYAALTGNPSPQEALSQLQARLEELTAG
ncbi:extracellular solute-binding protein family 1 [Xylanimonas cellulosilytica DSM 15894]|uniref:Extracellular solute-binding protein family 1 n=1 Tax=Xylanimonas cellulosilytica (strain DSM 15894 / JCM 12276 / CECT 5975 / KCTC 9989 / LMG 20990 / NBRC 107835 / XIL07) TaxID=446471 RepID=D1BYD9_XYLCX|nr:ABC transporter substrate-binding protein [Xylanimonas cellulosilytica]ACZ31811.1 extracellular solute-binding protein family 1 [Xylanimonas cellulosilytica DSM 15894]